MPLNRPGRNERAEGGYGREGLGAKRRRGNHHTGARGGGGQRPSRGTARQPPPTKSARRRRGSGRGRGPPSSAVAGGRGNFPPPPPPPPPCLLLFRSDRRHPPTRRWAQSAAGQRRRRDGRLPRAPRHGTSHPGGGQTLTGEWPRVCAADPLRACASVSLQVGRARADWIAHKYVLRTMTDRHKCHLHSMHTKSCTQIPVVQTPNNGLSSDVPGDACRSRRRFRRHVPLRLDGKKPRLFSARVYSMLFM